MEEKPKPSHAGRWIVLSLLALPVIYVLSFPWVDFYRIKQGWVARSSMGSRQIASPVVKAYWLPYEWLMETPLGPPFWDYYWWCNVKAGNPMHLLLE